jgi:membrane fusion protein, multidrug efflux system
MLKKIFGSILLLSLVVGVGYLVARQKIAMMTAAPPPPAEAPVIVRLAKPTPVSLRQSATAVGTILAPKSLHLRTEVVGTVAEISFKPGSEVHEGDVLLRLDTRVEDAQLAIATEALKMASSMAQRNQKAANVKAISELELEQSISQAVQAEAEVARLNAMIRKKTLVAPFNAKAGLFDVHVGQYLPEGTQITTLQGLDSFVHVDFMMPQQVADEVSVGNSIRILVGSDSLPAEVIAIDSQADRVTRNVSARAKLNDPPTRLQPNDSVRVEIEYGQSHSAVTIPAAGLRRSPTGAFVYEAVPDPTEPTRLRAFTRIVQPGMTVGQNVAIMHGIGSDSTIVADGSFKIHERAWVVDEQSSPKPPEPGSPASP